MPRRIPVVVALGLVLALGACGRSNGGAGQPAAATAAGAALATLVPGKLTVATGAPAHPPYVYDDDPGSGNGFESAVVYAVAAKLGFAHSDVVWVRDDFDKAIAPGPKDYDFNIQQVSISDERRKAVDFSAPYYRSSAALVTLKKNKAAGAGRLADLQGTIVGAATGTTTLSAVRAAIGREAEIQVYNSNEDAVQALRTGAIDALAVDLPTALYLTAVEIEGGVVIGQLPGGAGGDAWGVTLPKGSALTTAISDALAALAADGTLAAIEKQYLTDSAGAPILQ